MSPLEVLQLVGYSTAAALHLWIAALLSNRRRAPGKVERVLLPLAVAVGVWHASNFFVALHSMLGLAAGRWSPALKVADTLAVTSVTLTYSLLLHLHLHLWAGARRRPLNRTERARVYISYAPALFLAYALPTIWADGYEPMFARLSNLVLPFALWAAYVLCLVAGTDFLIARLSSSRRERRLMLTLAASFVSVAALILAVFAFGVGAGRAPGGYLQTLANLGSLLPTALLAYHIYRYRYLELAIKETLIVASFAAVVLVVYLYGIRTLALWATEQFGLRAAAVEAILILLLALVALRPHPQSFGWLIAWMMMAQASYLLQYIILPNLNISGQSLQAQVYYLLLIYLLPLIVWLLGWHSHRPDQRLHRSREPLATAADS